MIKPKESTTMPTEEPMPVMHKTTTPADTYAAADKSKRRKDVDDAITKAGG